MKHKAQLRKLARGLRKLPPEKFNMSHWIQMDAKRITCNTAGCAIGCLPRLVPECKLSLKPGMAYSFDSEQLEVFYEPYYRGSHGWGAIKKYFNINHEDVSYLFDLDYYYYPKDKKIPPSVVADKIENFLEKGSSERDSNEYEI